MSRDPQSGTSKDILERWPRRALASLVVPSGNIPEHWRRRGPSTRGREGRKPRPRRPPRIAPCRAPIPPCRQFGWPQPRCLLQRAIRVDRARDRRREVPLNSGSLLAHRRGVSADSRRVTFPNPGAGERGSSPTWARLLPAWGERLPAPLGDDFDGVVDHFYGGVVVDRVCPIR